MKTMKKLAGLLLALVMALATAAPAMAAPGENESPDTGKCTITIEMPYGIDMSAENTYTITRVFSAAVAETDQGAHIRYKLLDPSYTDLPEGFQLIAGDYVGLAGSDIPEAPDSSVPAPDPDVSPDASASEPDPGDLPDVPAPESDPDDLPGASAPAPDPDSLPDAPVSGLGQYIEKYGIGPAYVVKVQNGAVSGVDGASFTPEVPLGETGAKITIPVTPGYYYISTTTGSAVSVDSSTPHADVTDKSEVPTVTKAITDEQYEAGTKDAIVQAGDTVYFSITVHVAKGAVNYVLHDTMDKGLKYNEGSMSVAVAGVGESGPGAPLSEGEGGWTLTTAADSQTGGTALTVAFYDNGDPDTPNKVPNDVVSITVHYSATVTSGALSEDPAANTAYVSYGNGNKTTEDKVRVYNAMVTVYKTDGTNPLPGAKFKLRNAEGLYYNAVTEPDGTLSVEWGPDGGEVEARLADGNYVAEFMGLCAGSYTLEESTVPNGYNKADDVAFTIYDMDETIIDAGPEKRERAWNAADLKVEHTVVNQAGRELPDTGGIGTTVFTIGGGALMLGAAVLFIATKRSKGD